MSSRIFGHRQAFPYLEDQDRYLAQNYEPQLSYGFIGCGLMGVEHMRNTLLAGRAGVGGVYDPAAKSVEHALRVIGKQAAPQVYASLEEACADPNTDALVVATPNFTHLEVMRAISGCNKAIFLEKPIATTVPDALEVCQLASERENIVRVGLQYRYKAIYAEAIREVFDRDTVGRVHSVNLLEHRFPFLDKVGQWNKFNAYTGGTLIEKCCHYFDLMNMFADSRAEQVYATGNQAVNFRDFAYENKQADGIDQAHVNVRYKNGVIGAFSLNMFVPGAKEELIVCGDAGRLHASEQALLGQDHHNQLEIWAGENGASRTSTPSYPDYISSSGHHGATFFEHLAFADDVSSGAYSGPSMAEAFWSVVVGAAAQASIEHGAAVDVVDILPVGFDPDQMAV
jgi:predicted dehydrogenase